jgi:hypothetical protein
MVAPMLLAPLASCSDTDAGDSGGPTASASPGNTAPSTQVPGTQTPGTPAPGPTVATIAKDCQPPAGFDRKSFPAQPKVDNAYFPLVPGTQMVLEGSVTDEEGRQAHRVETTVTDLTKVIDGVPVIVVLERDFADGELEESELFFAAQDARGTVWYLGEYPEEYRGPRLLGAPYTWLSGQAEARPGIRMSATPRVGEPTYNQGLAPKVDFKDCATVFQTGLRVCVRVGCHTDVLVIDEFAPAEPAGGHQRKFYAPGVGNIQVGSVGGDSREELQLVKRTKVCGRALAAIRTDALAHDKRAYRKSVYRGTPPAKRTLTVAC